MCGFNTDVKAGGWRESAQVSGLRSQAVRRQQGEQVVAGRRIIIMSLFVFIITDSVYSSLRLKNDEENANLQATVIGVRADSQ